ncbi:MAG: hypothetical protein ACT4OZ_17225 [Gemmatimonadota bacterium]
MRTTSQPLYSAAIAALLTAVPATTIAQAAAPPTTTRSYVQLIRLKPEKVNEWLALQRNEVIPAQKKAAVESRTTLVTQVGPAFEYLIITPFPAWSAMDGDAPLVRALGADGAARLNARLRECILTQSSYMTTRQDSLSIPSADAPVWRTAIRRVEPGKMQEFLAFYRTDVLPAMKKAAANKTIAGSILAVRGVGAPTGEFTETTQYAKFADLDGGNPVMRAAGQEEAARINAKGALLATTVQVMVRRRLADLSF